MENGTQSRSLRPQWRLVIMVLLVFTFYGCSQPNSTALSSFLQQRAEVCTCLKESFSEPPTGTEFVPPAARLDDPLFPGDDHITSVVRRQRWQGRTMFGQTVLRLSDEDPASARWADFAAKRLLNHFFPRLENLGLRNMGNTTTSNRENIISIEQIWFSPGGELNVIGQVVVDSESHTAVVSCYLIEFFDGPAW